MTSIFHTLGKCNLPGQAHYTTIIALNLASCRYLYTVRLVVGSSAGAGSGDFHVYRGVRRREYARQKFLDEVTEKVSTVDDLYVMYEGKAARTGPCKSVGWSFCMHV